MQKEELKEQLLGQEEKQEKTLKDQPTQEEGPVAEIRVHGKAVIPWFKADITYRISGGRTKPKIVYVYRLWKYHGPRNYTWDNHGRPEADKDVMDVQ